VIYKKSLLPVHNTSALGLSGKHFASHTQGPKLTEIPLFCHHGQGKSGGSHKSFFMPVSHEFLPFAYQPELVTESFLTQDEESWVFR
jgi:hypothetical protein